MQIANILEKTFVAYDLALQIDREKTMALPEDRIIKLPDCLLIKLGDLWEEKDIKKYTGLIEKLPGILKRFQK